ncbi:hypothetical protein KKH36_03755 [Patescibacteria group bacterium]|nr:hypothetical protein [Patescibacteria group bacterium]
MNPTKLINFLTHPEEYPDCSAKEDLLKTLKNILESDFVVLEQQIYGIQTRCSCHLEEVEKVWEDNPNFKRGLGSEVLGSDGLVKILKGTRCSHCKTYTPRKEGSKFEVCLYCGSDMEDLNRKVEQAGVIKWVYECPCCELKELQIIDSKNIHKNCPSFGSIQQMQSRSGLCPDCGKP